jgi:hypothetical protein
VRGGEQKEKDREQWLYLVLGMHLIEGDAVHLLVVKREERERRKKRREQGHAMMRPSAFQEVR